MCASDDARTTSSIRPHSGLGSPRRQAASALAAVGAAAHLPLLTGHAGQPAYLGTLFTAYVVAAVALAVALVRRDTPAVWGAAIAVPGLALLGYGVSRAAGLPGADDLVGRWTDPLGLVACAAEAALVLLAASVLTAPAPVAATAAARRPLAAAAVLALGLASTLGAASAQARTAALGAAPAGSAAAPMLAGTTPGMTGDSYWSSVGGAVFTPTGKTRTYYVQSEEVDWNYAPAGKNLITGEPFGDLENTYLQAGPGRIGATNVKCLYRGYTDASFSKQAKQDAYLGFMGPVIRAEVGDVVKVVFRNSCKIPTSVHPHGVFYEKSSEGAPYSDGTNGKDKADDAVPTGGKVTYTWQVPDRAGPGPHDGSSVMWMYHSHTDEVGDTYAGLMGFMVVTAKGMARADGSPKDVDREVFELFSVMNENSSPYLQDNVDKFAESEPAPDDEGFEEANLKHSVNGFMYGNQPMVTLGRGDRVRWYVMGMGTEVDLHTPHWHGNDVVVGGMRMDVVNLLPASMVVADMVPDNAGTWLFHCHVNDHLTAGMVTRFKVV